MIFSTVLTYYLATALGFLPMGIVTKKGDKGKTSLFMGGSVSKDSPRVELNGTLDELSSFLGMAKCLIKEKKIKKCIEDIQKDLFLVGAEVATSPKFLKRLKKRMTEAEFSRLEEVIQKMEKEKRLKNFCFSLPGKNLVSSCFDVARTITRRAERRVVTLKKKKQLQNPSILIYLNRLSDLLYLLARKV